MMFGVRFGAFVLLGLILVDLSLQASSYSNSTSTTQSKRTTTSSITATLRSPSTTPKPSLTSSNSSCDNDCTVSFGKSWFYSWSPIPIYTTLTAATVILVVNNRTNTTRTITKTADLPSGFTVPPLNSEGTQVAVVTDVSVFGGSTGPITVTYPNCFTHHPSTFQWDGTFQFTANGSSSCATAVGSVSQYNSYAFSQPACASAASGDNGLAYTFVGGQDEWMACTPPAPAYAGIELIAQCSLVCQAASPAEAVSTALYVTETSISHEAGDPVTSTSSSPSPAQPINLPPSSTTSTGGPNGGTSSIAPPSSSAPSSPAAPSTDLGGFLSSLAAASTVAITAHVVSSIPQAPSPSPPPPAAHTEQPASPSPNDQPQGSTVATSQQGPASTTINSVPPMSVVDINPASTPVPIISIGGQTFTPNAASAYSIGGTTLTPGGTITAGDTIVALPPNPTAVIVNGNTLPFAAATPAPVISVGGQTYTADASSAYQIGSVVLTPGGVVTAGGTVLSLPSTPTAVVVNGNTQALAPPTPAPILTINGQTYTANSQSEYTIGGQTLTPGGAVTAQGTAISLAPSASILVVNGQTAALTPSVASVAGQPALTVNGQIITPTVAAGSPAYVVGSQTLVAGGSPITVAGSTFSLAPSGTAVVVNGVTSNLPAVQQAAATPPPLTLNGQTYNAIMSDGSTAYLIQGQTLSPGAAITVSGTTLSLALSGTALIINGQASTLPSPYAIATLAPLTLGGQVYSATVAGGQTAYIVAGQTLTPGGAIVVSGTSLSLSPSGTALVINGQTSTLPAPEAIITPAPLTLNGQTYTATVSSGKTSYVVSGQTLTPGGIITVSGSTLSLVVQGTALVINGQTSLVPVTSPSIGQYIQSGLGLLSASTGLASSASFTASRTVGAPAASATSSAAAVVNSRPGSGWALSLVCVAMLCLLGL